MADIPGLIEGASEGVGLGHEFLRHIERTKILIHVVDAASTEGRDPIDDIYKINEELKNYNEELASRPQVIAANKIDAIYSEDEDPVEKIRTLSSNLRASRYFPISAVSGKGVKELLSYMWEAVKRASAGSPSSLSRSISLSDYNSNDNLSYTVEQLDEHTFVVEGPKIEKMLGYTNLDSEKGFLFFQNFLKNTGILKDLEDAGIQDGDTVRMYGLQFDYYKE